MSLPLQAKGLRKRYGELEVVAGVDLEIAAGECFGLLGPNGAGKTTTLKLCLGLIEADAGEIRLLDHDVPAHAREARARVGVVPQFDNLDPDFTTSGSPTATSRRACRSCSSSRASRGAPRPRSRRSRAA